MFRLAILGRDGVINRATGGGLSRVEAFEPIPGSLEAIARLNNAGIRVVVATHQPGLATGELELDTLNAIHARIQQMLARFGGHIDGFFICPHGPDSECGCRSPAPGLLLNISRRFNVPLDGLPVIGSHIDEELAARTVKARAITVGSGPCVAAAGTERYQGLDKAVESLLREVG